MSIMESSPRISFYLYRHGVSIFVLLLLACLNFECLVEHFGYNFCLSHACSPSPFFDLEFISYYFTFPHGYLTENIILQAERKKERFKQVLICAIILCFRSFGKRYNM